MWNTRLLVVEPARGDVPLVVRKEQEIEPAQGAAAVVHAGGHEVPEHPLAGLAECLRRLADQRALMRAISRDSPASLGPFRFGHPRRLLGGAADPALHPEDDIFKSLVEAVGLARDSARGSGGFFRAGPPIPAQGRSRNHGQKCCTPPIPCAILYRACTGARKSKLRSGFQCGLR